MPPFKKNIVTKKANQKPKTKAPIAPESQAPAASTPTPPRSRASYYTQTEWSYETPLEPVPYPKRLHERVIEINGMKFQARSDTSYKINYYAIVDRVLAANQLTAAEKKKNPGENEINIFRNVIQQDLWFLVYFVMKNPLANHPFIVQACREIEDEQGDTLQVWARDHLKAVDLNEPVPTPSGWTAHGDLKAGDIVYGPDGKECSVLGVSEVFTEGDCYRVTFTDSTSVIVNGDHLWTVEKKSRKRISGTKNGRVCREAITLSTKKLSEYDHESDNRFSLPATKPLECNSGSSLPISPYVLGAWLGDGTSENGSMTCGDIEIWDEVRKEGFEISEGRPSYPITRTIYGLQKKLRTLGLLKNKHIPSEYLRASIPDRLALLQGLMDTDGTCNSRHTASFANKNRVLANGVYEICASLGLNPKFYEYHLSHGDTFFIAFQGYQGLPVFRLQRKLNNCAKGVRKNNRKFILSVDLCPTIPTSCIKVDREDGLYLIGRSMIPTHNTTIISTGRQVQKVLNDPERRIGIFSATRPLAIKIQGLIKELFQSDFLKACFPDILYDNPQKDAPKWSESPEGGLVVKRKGFYKEPTISSWGLVEGMPTGFHLTDIVCDDIVTVDQQTPEIMKKVCDNFDMLANIGTRDCQMTVVGTYYRHDDPLTYIAGKIDPVTNLPIFKVNKKAATQDGTLNGKAVFLPERTLAKRRSGQLYIFYCQQLLDPTPRGQEKLNRDNLITIKRNQLPENLYKFMLIDGAGDVGRRQDRKADAWAFAVVGIEPVRDNDGSNRIFILDMVIEPMDLITAQSEIVDMYLRNGRILKLCIEKVGMSSTEIHIVNALKAKKRFLSVEQGNLHILRPGGRSKQSRIENNLSWPLKNGKIHVLETVPIAYKERLCLEMEKFPMWNDDGLDMLSYVYDVAKEYRFGSSNYARTDETKKVDGWDEAFAKAKQSVGGELSWVEV